jgi:hypothetical protein
MQLPAVTDGFGNTDFADRPRYTTGERETKWQSI